MRHRSFRLLALTGVVSAASLCVGCGGAFYDTGNVTKVEPTQVCARFANGLEDCIAANLIDTKSDPSLGCLRVHRAGESASPLSAKYVKCDASVTASGS